MDLILILCVRRVAGSLGFDPKGTGPMELALAELLVLFRVSGKIHSFHLRGKRFFPGGVVELSSEEMARLNLDFLERLEASAEVSVVDEAFTLGLYKNIVAYVEKTANLEGTVPLLELMSRS